MNIPSTGNSGHKNRKWPKLAMLATAALLLSAISFIGIGAIPQPQQAFAQDTVNQSIEQKAENEVENSFVIKNTQSNEQTATQSVDTRGGGNGGGSTATDANGDEVTQSIKQKAENEVKDSIVGLNEQSNVQTATQSVDTRGGD